jgi:hypothetical protein
MKARLERATRPVRARAAWRRRLASRGVAGVEAALILPLMVFIIIGTIEVYQYFRAATILDRAAFTLANGISIQRELLDRGQCTNSNDICTYGAITRDLMTPLDYDRNGRVIFSVFAATEPTGRNPPPVRWESQPQWTRSYTGSGATGSAVSRLEPTRGFPPANRGDTVIVVEVFYDFEPFAMSSAFWETLGGQRRMYSRAFFRPRFSDIRELGG